MKHVRKNELVRRFLSLCCLVFCRNSEVFMAVFLKNINHRDEMLELGILIDAKNHVFLARQILNGFFKFLRRHALAVPIENSGVINLHQSGIVVCRYLRPCLGSRQ